MQICTMSHYTQGHKGFEQARTQGVAPGECSIVRRKTSSRKKSIVSKLLKSKGTLARDPEKARTRQEKKTCLKKMEINTFT